VTQSPPTSAKIDAKAAARVRRIVTRSGSSFLWGMRMLPRPRREAMYAIYAFCREVDDIADGPGETDERMARLAEWRTEIEALFAGQPSRPVARALLPAVAAFGLPRAEFLAIIEGMEMDVADAMRAPAAAELDAYCRRVAGAVGLLSIRAFGAAEPEAQTLALVLGRALQLTNILRDLVEDGALGRLYLPRELLAAHGIDTREPAAALAHPGLPGVCAEVVADARAGFVETRRLLSLCEKRPLRPSIAMMEVYERILGLLEARGWRQPGREVHVSSAEKLWIAVRLGLAW
jgi:phytoene synthase